MRGRRVREWPWGQEIHDACCAHTGEHCREFQNWPSKTPLLGCLLSEGPNCELRTAWPDSHKDHKRKSSWVWTHLGQTHTQLLREVRLYWDQRKRHFYSTLCVLNCLVVSDSLQPQGLKPAWLLCPWDFPDKNSGMGCHSFSRGSSWPRDGTRISYIDRWVLYH